MKFTYENQGTNTFLVYRVSEEDVIDTMSLGMLTNNKIYGLAPTVFTQIDSEKFIKYNISSKVSASQILSGGINKKRLISIFSGIVEAMLSAEDYMIDSDTVLLDPEYIFVDVSTGETLMICLPVVSAEKQNIELNSFIKNILFSAQFDPGEDCDYLAKIMNYLNNPSLFSMSGFKEVLAEIRFEKQQTPKKKTREKSTPVQNQVVEQTPIKVDIAVNKTAENRVIANEKQLLPNNPPSGGGNTGNNSGIVIPGRSPISQNPPEIKKDSVSGTEKKIGVFDLLMHYSKENVELYKEQKKKNGEKTNGGKEKTQKKKAKDKKSPSLESLYPIPGQQIPAPGKISSEPAAVRNDVMPVKIPEPVAAKTAVVSENLSAPVIEKRENIKQGFGETVVLNGGAGETTVLTAVFSPAVQKPVPYLIRIKTGEKVPVNKPVFRIGKERSFVDFFIGDNTAISRSHANIIDRDGVFFVIDTNSTNHTYVNNQMIPSNSEVEIVSGTRIRLANEDFEFVIC